MRLTAFLRENAPYLSAGFLLTFGSAFGQTYFISVFAGEIRGEFGLTHAAWGQIYSIGTLISAAVMVWAGAQVDRFRIRATGLAVLLGLAFACLFMAGTPAAWALIPAIFLLRFTGQGMMSHLGAVSMARWFVASRGRALSIAGLGFAAAEALLPILFVALLAVVDWRLLWVAGAGVTLLLIPILLRLLRLERTPQSLSGNDRSTGLLGGHWTRAQALRHRLFWFMVPTVLGPSAFVTALFFQQVHVAEVKGWSHLEFVALIPAYTLSSVGAMLVSGALIDRFGTARLMPFFQLPMAVGFVLMAMADTPAAALMAFVVIGLTTGANSTLPAAFWAEFYGTAHIGSIKALATAIMVLGSAIGPGLTGTLITAGIGIESQFLGMAAYFLFASLMIGIGLAAVRRSAIAP